jgi:predicted membrane-bound spermidine synthase
VKLTVKNVSTLLGLGFLGAVVGGLAWEVVERVCLKLGFALGLSVGPIGFDLSVISLHFLVNPGTIFGLLGGVVLFHFL